MKQTHQLWASRQVQADSRKAGNSNTMSGTGATEMKKQQKEITKSYKLKVTVQRPGMATIAAQRAKTLRS